MDREIEREDRCRLGAGEGEQKRAMQGGGGGGGEEERFKGRVLFVVLRKCWRKYRSMQIIICEILHCETLK